MTVGNDISYEITEHLGTISTRKNGWTVEVNYVSWNGNDEKIDIRPWSPDHERMGKGIALTEKEANELLEILSGI